MFNPRKMISLVALVVVGFLSQTPEAAGSVGGSLNDPKCPSSGVLYINASSIPMNFELVVNNNSYGSCSDTLSWTDSNGNAQSITVAAGTLSSVSLSSSIPPDGTITWISSGTGNTGLVWQLERAPAQSISGESVNLMCGSSGIVYSNLTSAAVNLDVAVSAVSGNYVSCLLTLTWTDASGEAQALHIGSKGSSGVSTSLPAGGVISWTSRGSTGAADLSWQIERVDTSQLW